MKLEVYTYTNQGGQEHNEDSLYYLLDGENGFFVLADGLGGHHNGQEASALAVKVLTESLARHKKADSKTMKKAFLDAGTAILERQSDPCCAAMRTTAVALSICRNQAVWGHIGDSRLYYFSNGKLAYVTQDHSVTYKKYLGGDISYAQIRGDEDRSSLLRTLGNPEKCIPEVLQTPRMLQEGDAFLLCSDGFWEYVWEEEMLIDLLKAESPDQWAEYMLLRHIRRTKPFYDNLSLIALFVGEGGF